MTVLIDFLKNLGLYFISINVNAFYAILYFLTENWLIILSIISIGILMYSEIEYKSEEIIDDKRDIY